MKSAINEKSPIGVFDSGLGGLTVVKALREQLPLEQILYYGDTAHVPYGDREPGELIGFATNISDYLVKNGCKLIIIACNTSTALAYNLIRAESPVPVIGVIEPGVRCALDAGGKGPIGIIATQVTVQSGAYQKALAHEAPERKIIAAACPPFVPLVESGRTTGPEAEKTVRDCLAPIKAEAIESLILGCTHYPFLADIIKAYMGDAVKLIDPAWETVRQAKMILFSRKLMKLRGEAPEYDFVCSGDPDQFAATGSFFLGMEIKNVRQALFDREAIRCEQMVANQGT